MDNIVVFNTSLGDSRITRARAGLALTRKQNKNVPFSVLYHQPNKVSFLISRLAPTLLLFLILISKQVLFVPPQNVLEALYKIMVDPQVNG